MSDDKFCGRCGHEKSFHTEAHCCSCRYLHGGLPIHLQPTDLCLDASPRALTLQQEESP